MVLIERGHAAAMNTTMSDGVANLSMAEELKKTNGGISVQTTTGHSRKI
nr:hypothetical protein Iba_chr12cCG8660 [Ipomoea batatas]GME12848.1 hypothetical protein Iba_scaffold14188CG0010 [Ipomoea batatas]GME20969.1 hypothetical protein Iba_scaffold26500CG0010 [Ipomoea batatas]